jgi:hypothetical protein
MLELAGVETVIYDSEGSVSEYDVSNTNQGSMWQLLLQIAPSSGTTVDVQPVARITDALSRLGLQPAEVERIGQAMLASLNKTRQREDWDPACISIRVWTPIGSAAEGPAGTCSAVPGVWTRTRGGWGFFVLAREEGESRKATGTPDRVIELYVYQEG